MFRQKAVLVDFECINRPFDETDPGLIDYVMATNDELASRIYAPIRWLLLERSPTAKIWTWLQYPNIVVEDFAEIPEEMRPNQEDFESVLDELRLSISEARESGSYKHQFYDDFPIAASDWLRRAFKCVVFSHSYWRAEILEMLERNGVEGDVIAVKVPRNKKLDWVEGLATDLGLDLRASFLILANMFGAREVRNQVGIKTAVLDRIFVGQPYEEPGYYLNIGSLLDIDPEPDGVDIRSEISEETSLTDFIKTRPTSKLLSS